MRQLTEEKIDPEVILNSINDGVVTIGLDRRVHYINEAALRILGFRRDEALGAECSSVIRCAACSSSDCLMDRTLSTGSDIRSYDTWLVNKGGERVPITVNASLLRDEDGTVIGEVEVIRDISEQMKLSEELHGKFAFGKIIGKNHRMQEVYDILPSIAATKTTVLIEGETGTGKELIAHAIHENSARAGKPFIKFNCAALAEGVLESELFGHVKGAFTGAVGERKGRFEQAHGGTIFLDEIGDISPGTQIRLLRVLQEEAFERVGGTDTIQVDVRVIAATHRDLKQMVREGTFREDLYYRLRIMPVHIPPLRERHDDIPLLIRHFLAQFNQEMGKEVREVSPEAMEVLMNYPYPGNVRELQNILEHAMVLCRGTHLTLHTLPKEVVQTSHGLVQITPSVPNVPQLTHLTGLTGTPSLPASGSPLRAVEREAILQVLEQCGWRLGVAADVLGMSRTTLWRRMRRFGIDKHEAD
ncbi:MAG: sigma 54-interacting transcriptional regulator [Nitrospirota bacterium]|nr:sigma 54-interacting transcriptional regulator [Nitrospirota bacterium]